MEGPEAIFEIADPAAKIQGFLVVDSTRLGPAFGGVRIRAYGHEREALLDAMDLAAAMTVKAALAGLACGGGKIVLIERRGFDRRRAMDLLGRALEDLRGRFFAGRDYGMSRDDLDRLRRATRFAADEAQGALGDLGEATARGTLAALRAALAHRASAARPGAALLDPSPAAVRARARDGTTTTRAASRPRRPADDGLDGATIAVQGTGAVGLAIVRQLLAAGAEVVAADPDRRAVRRAADLGARIVPSERLAAAAADAFVPAAAGRLLDEEFARRCRAGVLCGPANNAIASLVVEMRLRRRGIISVPDVLVGAGALIAGALLHLEGIEDPAPAIDAIGPRVARFLARAERSRLLPSELARSDAAARLRRAGPRGPSAPASAPRARRGGQES